MPTFAWTQQRSEHFGEGWVPVATLGLADSQGIFLPIDFRIDSGAVISLVRRRVADALGISLQAGRRVALGSLAVGELVAYVHQIITRIEDGPPFIAPFAIAESDVVPNLLGRLGVFDHWEFVFDPIAHETHIRRPLPAEEQA